MTDTIATTESAPSPEFFTELAKAQSEFTIVRKNRKNPATNSQYADLQSVFDAVKPALNKYGFFVFQRVTSSDSKVNVETLLGHRSGETLSSGILSVPYAELKNGRTNAAQALGSARTYACRYSLCSLLCVTAEDDDDGNASADPQNAPARPAVNQALREASAAAAAKGLNAYKAYFDSLDLPTRKLLIETGTHETNKAAAKAVDSREASHAE